MKPGKPIIEGVLRNKRLSRHSTVLTFDQVDRQNDRWLRVLPFCAALGILAAWMAASLARAFTLAVFSGFSTLYWLASCMSILSERSDHLYAHHEWRSVPEGVELTSIKSWHSRACMNLPNSIVIVGCLITLAIPWFAPYRIPGSIGSSMAAISLLAILVFGVLVDEPRKPRTRPAILLRPEGILAWPNEPYRCRIPWTTFPEATGIRHYGLNIVTRKRLQFLIPLKHLNHQRQTARPRHRVLHQAHQSPLRARDPRWALSRPAPHA